MASPEIVHYVKEQLQKGTVPEAIRANLLRVGWKPEDITEALKDFGQVSVATSVGHAPQNLRDELKSLRQAVEEINSRLFRLEESASGISWEAQQEELQKPPVAAEIPGQVSAEVTPAKTESVETKITGKWFAGLGVLAILFGAGFFLKYAFENNWIGPTGRVVMGVLGGLVMLVLGDFLSRKEKYRQYSFFISGGGLALLYLSIFGAFNYYQLIDQATAFVFLVLITVGGTLLSLKSDSERLMVLSLLGGFLTPFLVSTGVDNQIVLMGYILVLDLGLLAVSYFKKWMRIYFLSFVGTYVIFYSWYGTYYDELKNFSLTLTFLTLFYAIFVAATFLRSVFKKFVSNSYEAIAIVLNGALYFSTAYTMLHPSYKPFLGFFFVIWAAAHLLAAYAVQGANREDKNAVFALGGAGLVLATLAIPIQLDYQWITIAWAAEAVVLLWVGFSLPSYPIRIFANMVFVLTAIRLLAFEMELRGQLQDFTPVFNTRFYTFLIATAALFLGSYLYRVSKDRASADEKWLPGALGVAANLAAVMMLSNESVSYFDKSIEAIRLKQATPNVFGQPSYNYYDQQSNPEARALASQKNLSLSVIWGLYSGFLMFVGILKHSRYARMLSILGLGVVVLKVFLYDAAALSDLYRIISFMTLGATLLVVSFLFYRYKEKIKQFIFE